MSIFDKNAGLVRRFREGQRDALEEVYWAYVDKVAKIIRFGFSRGLPVRVAGTAGSDVDDLVQEVFTRAFAPHIRRSYDDQRPYEPYLFTIARNVLADWHRRTGREVLDDGQALETTVEEEPPERDYADPRTTMVVERFVAALEPVLRAVHQHRFVAGLSQREAAAALGLSRQNLRTLEQRLRDGLRAALEADDAIGQPVAAAEGKDASN